MLKGDLIIDIRVGGLSAGMDVYGLLAKLTVPLNVGLRAFSLSLRRRVRHSLTLEDIFLHSL